MNGSVRRFSLTRAERGLVEGARVARLATVRPDGRPHLVPVTFAFAAPDLIVTAVDHKPKRTTALQRLRNIEAHPAASLLVDHYDDDWAALWWVRIDAAARVVLDEPFRTTLVGALVHKYEAYAAGPPDGPVIALEMRAVASWSVDGKR